MLNETKELLATRYGVGGRVLNLICGAEEEIAALHQAMDEIRAHNQIKVLDAFREAGVAARHFLPSSGYGYDDAGRDTLDILYAKAFRGEDALVRPHWTSGTHVLSDCLFALLRPGQTLLSVTGGLYETLESAIGLREETSGQGTLKDFGVRYAQVNLDGEGLPFAAGIERALSDPSVALVYIQRSRGYSWRKSLSIDAISSLVKTIRSRRPEAVIMLDNCYGEFTQTREPLEVGVDLIAGSLIKNPGGGLAPTGGYACGRKDLIEKVSYRLTLPGVGREIGSYAAGYTPFYQGLFLAPHIVAESIKGCVLAARVFERLGFAVEPKSADADRSDIIQSIRFSGAEELILFCRAIQKTAPVDSFVVPEPWDMPGYRHQVIMAAGTFMQGASLELSADAPICPPYIGYLQGGLTYDHCRAALCVALQMLSANNPELFEAAE